MTDEPDQALDLLTDAHKQLDIAAAANVSATVLAPLRKQVEAGLDRLYGVVPVASTDLYTFTPAEGAEPIDLSQMVRGPDGNPYVIDRTNKAVYRIGLKTKEATLVVKQGTKNKSGTVATPRYLGVGGQDLLILDSKNVLWRWRPSERRGQGHARPRSRSRARPRSATTSWASTRSCGPGRAACTTCTSSIRPSSRSGPTRRPPTAAASRKSRPPGWPPRASVAEMTSTFVDGDLFAADTGDLVRFVGGKNEGWTAKAARRTASCVPRRTIRSSRPARPGAKARSTASTRRTSGSWPSPRSTASTSPNTASPATPRTGRTCARCTSSPASTPKPSTLVWMSRRRRPPGHPRRRPG